VASITNHSWMTSAGLALKVVMRVPCEDSNLTDHAPWYHF
jgi:hypothetical protein